MKIGEAISTIDSLKFNNYTPVDKIGWLSRVDWMVKRIIVDAHEGADNVSFIGYDENTTLDTELLVPAPFDELYISYLEAQIDYSNGEYAKYNNSIMMFNSGFEAYSAYYTRNNMPKSSGKQFVF